MKRIGITGGIGSGKSTVCQIFEQYGYAVYYSDIRAKELMAGSLRPQIEKLFGHEAYIDGCLNRGFIAAKVFNDSTLLSRLNSIVHPAVACDFEDWAIVQKTPLILLESAILFESGFNKMVDNTIFVDAPLEIRVERTMRRDGKSREEIMARIANQSSDCAKSQADFIINNDTIDNLRTQIETLRQQLLSI
jgi:dephospho-CoA kinase